MSQTSARSRRTWVASSSTPQESLPRRTLLASGEEAIGNSWLARSSTSTRSDLPAGGDSFGSSPQSTGLSTCRLATVATVRLNGLRLPYSMLSASGRLSFLERSGSDSAFADRISIMQTAERANLALKNSSAPARAWRAKARGRPQRHLRHCMPRATLSTIGAAAGSAGAIGACAGVAQLGSLASKATTSGLATETARSSALLCTYDRRHWKRLRCHPTLSPSFWSRASPHLLTQCLRHRSPLIMVKLVTRRSSFTT